MIFKISDGFVAFNTVLTVKLCLVHFSNNDIIELNACLIAKTNMSWLRHHRLAYVEMRNLHKLLRGEYVLGPTNVFLRKTNHVEYVKQENRLKKSSHKEHHDNINIIGASTHGSI
jgi:hypothetical protein